MAIERRRDRLIVTAVLLSTLLVMTGCGGTGAGTNASSTGTSTTAKETRSSQQSTTVIKEQTTAQTQITTQNQTRTQVLTTLAESDTVIPEDDLFDCVQVLYSGRLSGYGHVSGFRNDEPWAGYVTYEAEGKNNDESVVETQFPGGDFLENGDRVTIHATVDSETAEAAGYTFATADARRDMPVSGLPVPVTNSKDISQALVDATEKYLKVRFKDGIDQQYYDVQPDKRYDNLSVGPVYFLTGTTDNTNIGQIDQSYLLRVYSYDNEDGVRRVDIEKVEAKQTYEGAPIIPALVDAVNDYNNYLVSTEFTYGPVFASEEEAAEYIENLTEYNYIKHIKSIERLDD